MKRTGWKALLAGTILGSSVWALSPAITGHAEPWDAPTIFYLVGLFIAGVIAACMAPGRFWMGPIGIILGQWFYMLLFLQKGPLLPLGLAFVIVYSVFAWIGALLVFGIGKKLSGKTKI